MMKQKYHAGLCFLVLSIAISGCSGIKSPNPVVKTSHGKISGLIDEGIYTFKGIPYAKAERFMPPHQPEAWKGVRECVDFSKIAMQVNSWSPDSAMDEKELFTLNVWSQGLNDGKKRAVMVWLHGGGFSTGASDDPISHGKMLAKTGDVVLVSINHRLNILGFLDLSACGDAYAQSANIGMLDIVEALKWVQENIEKFGGDPNNVTIFGESGGGGKVGTLMCMPPAKELFHKAIIQSGTLINVMTKEKSAAVGLALLDVLGLTPEQVDQLNTIPYKKLVEAGDKALANTVGTRRPGTPTMFGFGPVPDGKDLLQQPFTPDFADLSNDVPLLIGTTLNELARTSYGEKDLSLEQAKERLKQTYGDRTDEYIALYAKTYPNYTPQDLLSIDPIFRPNTIMVADARANKKQAPVYTYLLTWKSPVEDGTRGSFHGVDIPLAFNNIELGKHWTGNSDDAQQLADKMSAAWINFAKTGNPNVEGVLPAWKAYTQENGETMIFDSACSIVNNHDRELMQFIKATE
ncbi:MAG: carboxylesterase/lipase family protein [Pontiellaceae bacterium]|nr:carboxylesterase/lipase family protein [Pontiellaceae bacterium]